MRTDLKFLPDRASRARGADVAAQLRSLPRELDPPYDWNEFQRRRVLRGSSHVVRWPHAAAAAGITVVVAAAAFLAMKGAPDIADPNEATAATPTDFDEPNASWPERLPDAQASAAREWLARQAHERAVVRVGPQIVVSSLEDRIAWFDDALTAGRLQGADPGRVKVLEQERARLVSTLAQVRYAESLMGEGS